MSSTADPTSTSLLGNMIETIRDHIASAWTLISLCLMVALFIGGAYLIDQSRNTYLGIVLVGLAFSQLSGYGHLGRRRTMAQHLIDVVAETRAAVTLELYLKIDAILQHPKCVEAFHRLQALKRIPPEVDVAEWQRKLLDKFRERASLPADEQPWAHAVFEIRGSQRWVNGTYQPSPVIHYEVLIPEDALKSRASVLHGDSAYHGLTIRTFVLNGVLKVQVGQWGDEEEGSREPGQIVPWMAWDTITTFPLLLNPADHYLPARFLLLDYFIQPMHRPGWSRAKRRFQRDVEEYRRILSTFGEYGEARLWHRQTKRFNEWLQREGFEKSSYSRPDNWWSNQFLTVSLDHRDVDYSAYQWLSDEARTTASAQRGR